MSSIRGSHVLSRRVVATLSAVGLTGALLGTSVTATAQAPDLAALDPGGTTELAETVAVNIVYVGIDADPATVEAELATTGSPVMRYPAFYGEEADLGIRWSYDYTHVTPDDAWTDAFYAQLDVLAGEHTAAEPLTVYQQAYNTQANALRTLEEADNQYLEAAAVERWLADNPPAGVDASEPTIFYVDRSIEDGWFPHVYVKTNEPDPDTGYNFGEVRQTRKITAWGGTPADDEEDALGSTKRVWFYDLSSGPDLWQDGYDVTTADLTGDGVPDYRIPPAWHYDDGGYVHPGTGQAVELSTDLGLVTRYVAVNLLFTTSPLYPPYFTPDRIPDTVNVDVNTVEGWKRTNASEEYIDADLFLAEQRDLTTGYDLTLERTDVAFKGDVKQCYYQWVQGVECYNRQPTYPADANLFLNWAYRTPIWQEGDADYEAGMVNYAIGQSPKEAGFLGFADDNWQDGTQSGVFSFVSPGIVSAGYGLTTTMIHEYGHHTSLSHPHDGYDPQTGVDYGPENEFYFAWLGDMSNSMMSYIDLNWDFSQFDRDNTARHHAAGFVLVANDVAAAIEGEPGADAALTSADASIVAAQAAFAAHDYDGALFAAEAGYRTLLAWADANGVDVAIEDPGAWGIREEANRGSLQREQVMMGATDLDPRHTAKRFE